MLEKCTLKTNLETQYKDSMLANCSPCQSPSVLQPGCVWTSPKLCTRSLSTSLQLETIPKQDSPAVQLLPKQRMCIYCNFLVYNHHGIKASFWRGLLALDTVQFLAKALPSLTVRDVVSTWGLSIPTPSLMGKQDNSSAQHPWRYGNS